MQLPIKLFTLALGAVTYAVALPSQTVATNSTPLTKRDSSNCFACGNGINEATINTAISKFCSNENSGHSSFQYIYDNIFYTDGFPAQLSLGVRATGAAGCPANVEVTSEGCTIGFQQITEDCNVGEEAKQGGVYKTTCLEWEINPNLKGLGESSCGGDTIWPN